LTLGAAHHSTRIIQHFIEELAPVARERIGGFARLTVRKYTSGIAPFSDISAAPLNEVLGETLAQALTCRAVVHTLECREVGI
jgi:hypothetical protein